MSPGGGALIWKSMGSEAELVFLAWHQLLAESKPLTCGSGVSEMCDTAESTARAPVRVVKGDGTAGTCILWSWTNLQHLG